MRWKPIEPTTLAASTPEGKIEALLSQDTLEYSRSLYPLGEHEVISTPSGCFTIDVALVPDSAEELVRPIPDIIRPRRRRVRENGRRVC